MNHCIKAVLVTLSAALFTACAIPTRQQDNCPPTLSAPDAQKRYQQGLTGYRAHDLDPALKDLEAAAFSGRLKAAEEMNARKHIAFIHCVSAREVQCREQFRTMLQIDPKFDLAPNEAGHPSWGPVWRSLKGAVEEKQAIKQASGLLASAAQNKLAEGIKQYHDGLYNEAIESLQSALKSGLSNSADQIRAHKYSAFTHCLAERTTLCRSEFRKIFNLDPTFEMLPSENGHPAWASAYRNEKAAAARRAKQKK